MERHTISITIILVLSTCFILVCPAVEPTKSEQNSIYLDAVRIFADNILKYGRDTYGPKHTPLFVDGLNVHTREPVKWISPKGDVLTATETEEWILSNFASQQTLLRTLDGLSAVTGDPKYHDAAKQAIKYAFENLRAPNGLFYWGTVAAYDALTETIRGLKTNHTMKFHYPYYELMWDVDPDVTKKFIEAFWAAHITDWSNLDMNRYGRMDMSSFIGDPWSHEYKNGPSFFNSKSDSRAFMSTGSGLIHAGAMLYRLSKQEEPLIWSKRLAKRYVDVRHPNTGISYGIYNTSIPELGNDLKEHFNDPRTTYFPRFPCFAPDSDFFRGGPLYHENRQAYPWMCLFLAGKMLDNANDEFTEWALQEFTAWGRASYRKEDNVFVPILTNGVNLEGYVWKNVHVRFVGTKDIVIEPYFAGPSTFWPYAVAYSSTGDKFMWEMARNIAIGNGFGDIGGNLRKSQKLKMDTTCSDVYGLLGFLELYAETNKSEFLSISRRIADNILETKFNKGFFTQSKQHVYSRFDCFEPLALLHLATIESNLGSVPRVWPCIPKFQASYRFKRSFNDRFIYDFTGSSEVPMSLQEAAGIGDIDLVGSLINDGIAIDALDNNFCETALHRAVISGHKDIVELLLSRGADVNARDSFPCHTPLHYAAERGFREIVEILIANGADIEAVSDPTRTSDILHWMPVQFAARAGHKEIVELLVKKGTCIPNIHVAASFGEVVKVEQFLKNGIDVNAKDEQDKTPIFYAVENNCKDIVGFLIASGANVNAKDEKGMTPLHTATKGGYKHVAELLINKGADVDGKDNSGYIPLSWAIWNEDRDMIKLLVTNGADVNFVGENDWPFLHYLTWNNDRELVKLFLAHEAELNVKDNSGRTEFHIAVSRGHRDLARFLVSRGATAPELHLAAGLGDLARVKSLVEKGVDVDKRDEVGWTPLYWAASTAEEEVAEFLVGKGAAIDVRTNNKRTLLHQAATAGAAKLTSLLISKGADSNARDEGNGTPLHSAAAGGHKNVVELLITNGADVKTKDRRGRTPIDLAQRAEHVETIDLLYRQMQVHDIAVTNMSVSPDCKQGDSIRVVATVENRGDRRDSLAIRLVDVTADKEIGSQSVVLLGKRQSKPDLRFDTSSGGIADTGNRVRMSGDMNGDGYNDILLNGPMWNDYRGRVFLYFGGPNLNTTPDMTFSGENPGDRLGDYGAITTGDLNKDGYDDVIVGAFGYPGGKNDGRVYIYYGGAEMDNIPDIVFDGETGQRSFFGLTLANSDIDQDGFADLLVAAQNYDHGGEYHRISTTREFGPFNGRGRVYLYWGSESMDTNPDIIFEGENRGDWFGRRISAKGDVNGDSYNDIVIGARHAVNDSRGRAYLFWGNTQDQMNATCDWIFTGEGKNDNMGSSVCIFDIDSDGCSDVILGARFAADYAGRVYIYWGEKDFDGRKPDVVLEGEAESRMGGDEITCGYFNADKYGDIIAGAWGNNKWGTNSGQAYLFYGNTKSLIDTECDHTFDSEGGVEDAFGISVSAGNVNNDNYDDVLIGAPKAYEKVGRGYLYYGPFYHSTDLTFNWDTTTASLGKHVLKVTIAPVAGEVDFADNSMTVEVEVKER
jgi:pectate lyase